MQLTATNRSRAYPGRSSGLIQVEMISICGFEGMFEMNRSFKKEMHEWLSGGASPCQGEGRGFESRLVLFLFKRKAMRTAKKQGQNVTMCLHMRNILPLFLYRTNVRERHEAIAEWSCSSHCHDIIGRKVN